MNRADCMRMFGRLETALHGHRELVETRFAAVQGALELASHVMEQRLDGMNEFRDTLRDQASRFATRTELEGLGTRVEVDLRMLREAKAALEGKASQRAVLISVAISVVGLVIGMMNVLVIYLKGIP